MTEATRRENSHPCTIRIDPTDGSAFTLDALLALNARFGTGLPRRSVDRYWREECRVPPFAASALWAAHIPEVEEEDGSLTGGSRVLAIVAAWRYAVNNLRLAIGAPQSIGHSAPANLKDVNLASTSLENFTRSPSQANLKIAISNCRAVFETWGPWLLDQQRGNIAVSLSSCFAQLPVNEALAFGSCARNASVTLKNGVVMPLLAFGTWQLCGPQAYDATLNALKTGYRHIDTAHMYMNEIEVGRAIRDSRVARSEIFIATKSYPEPMAEGILRQRVMEQLRKLGVDYIDLYMLHAPGESKVHRESVWRELEDLHLEGKIRALGVSNFDVVSLRGLCDSARVPPIYVQNKLSVYAPGEQIVDKKVNLLAYCQNHGLQMMAYSVNNPWPAVLAPMHDPHVQSIAARYNRTPAQVLLRWALQMGAGVIAKSGSLARIAENCRIFDFALGDTDFKLLTGLVTLSEGSPENPSPLWAEDVYGMRSFNMSKDG